MIDLARALKYPFAGPNALRKMLIGALFYVLIPFTLLTGPILLGYQVRVIRQVLRRQDGAGLPEWDRVGGDLVEGLKVFAGSLLYYLPAIILAALGAVQAWRLVSEMLSTLDVIDLVVSREGVAVQRGEIGMICLLFTLAMLWLVISSPLIMTALARYAETGEFAVFIRLPTITHDVWQLRGAAGTLMLMLFALGVLFQALTALLSALAITCFFTGFIHFVQFAAVWHLNGQWAVLLKQHRPARPIIRPINPPAKRAPPA